MIKLLAALCVAAITFAIAGHALALNPQPLPPHLTPKHRVDVHYRRHSPIAHGVGHGLLSPRDAHSGLATGKRMH